MRPRALITGMSTLSALLITIAFGGCSSSASRDRRGAALPVFCQQSVPASGRCIVVYHSRFTVLMLAPVASAAERLGLSPSNLVTRPLDRIAQLLPGPETNILIQNGTRVIPGTGIAGATSQDGQVTLTVDTEQSTTAMRRSLTVWLVQDLSHEVNHSVRIEAGPGCGRTLLDLLICEGVASAFDLKVQPALRLPWLHVLNRREESALWSRARRVVNDPGLEGDWFFGGRGIPYWAGYQIGYDIVRAYMRSHPGLTAAALVRTPASTVLAASHYAP